MRVLADVTKNTILVSLYQAGNQIYEYVPHQLIPNQCQVLLFY